MNLQPLLGKKLIAIRELSEFDIRFEFLGDMIIDFLNCFSEEDEILHILHIEGFYWALGVNNQWEYGKSQVIGKREKYIDSFDALI